MAALAAACRGPGRKKLTAWVTVAAFRTLDTDHAVLWRRGCSQYKPVTSNEDMPITMDNPYKEPLKRCILCKKRVDYKNVQARFPKDPCKPDAQGLCGKKQKEITKAIKRAQIMGFMPVTYKDPAYLKDPKVCNIRYRE